MRGRGKKENVKVLPSGTYVSLPFLWGELMNYGVN